MIPNLSRQTSIKSSLIHYCSYSEPTNHLDMESIDALAKAVNEFEGGMVLVSHDMRLISQVAKEIWICDHKTITMYKGDIQNFKMDMRAQMHLDDDKEAKSKSGGKGKLRGDASVMKKSDDDLAKEKAKKEAPKASQNGNGKKSGSGSLESLLAPTQRDESEVKDAWDVQDVKESLPPVEEPQAPAPKKYIPPHLRNKQ